MKLFVGVVILCCVVSIHGKWNDFWTKDCCDPHDDEHRGWICDDGERAPVIGCCGKGSCNVMCCNCDGGCRAGDHKPFKLLGVWGASITPNFGISGTGGPAAGAEFTKELAQTAAIESGKGGYAFGREATKDKDEDESGIEYHPWRH